VCLLQAPQAWPTLCVGGLDMFYRGWGGCLRGHSLALGCGGRGVGEGVNREVDTGLAKMCVRAPPMEGC
jgi:hypothetical protein